MSGAAADQSAADAAACPLLQSAPLPIGRCSTNKLQSTTAAASSVLAVMAASSALLPPLVGLSRSAPRPSRPSTSLLLSPLFSFATHTPGPHGGATLSGLQSCLHFLSERNLEECAIKAHHYAQCGDLSSARETYSLMIRWIDAALDSPEVGRHAAAGFTAAREAKMAAAVAQRQHISAVDAGAAVAIEAMQRAEAEAAAAGGVSGSRSGRSTLHPFVLAYLPQELGKIRSILQLNLAELEASESGEEWNQPTAVSAIGRRRTDGRLVLFRNDEERQQWKARVQQAEHQQQMQMEQQQMEMREQEAKIEDKRQWHRLQKEQRRLQQKERLERFKQQEQLHRLGWQQQSQLHRWSERKQEPALTAAHSAAAAASAVQPVPRPPSFKQLHQPAQAQQQPFFQQASNSDIGLFFKHSSQLHAAAAARMQPCPDELAPAARSSLRPSAGLANNEEDDVDLLSEPVLTPYAAVPNMPASPVSLFQPSDVAAAAAAAGAEAAPRLLDESQPSVTSPEEAATAAALQSASISLFAPDLAQPIATGLLSDDGGEEVFIPLPAPPPAPKLQPKMHAEEEDEEEAPTQLVRRDRSKRRAVPVDDTPEMRGADEEQAADEILAYIESGRSMKPRAAEAPQVPSIDDEEVQVVSMDEVRSPQASGAKAAARAESQKSHKRRRRHISDSSAQSDSSEDLQPAEAQRGITHASVSIKPQQPRKRPRSSLRDEGEAAEPTASTEAVAAQQPPSAPLGVSKRKASKRAKAARSASPEPSQIKVEAKSKEKPKRSRKATVSSSLPTSQAMPASALAAVSASPLEVHAQFKQQQHLVATGHETSATASARSANQSAEGATAVAAASPTPAPSTIVDSPLPAKVRKLVTDSATGQQRYEWVFEQRSWARPHRRLESRLETVEPAVADRSKAKAAGIIASMRPVKAEPVKAESKMDEEETEAPSSSVTASDPRQSQWVSPSLDDDEASQAEPLSAPQS